MIDKDNNIIDKQIKIDNIKKHENELSNLRIISKKSILSAQTRNKINYTDQKSMLFDSGLRKRDINKSDLESSKNVTNSLKRTRDIMKTQIDKFNVVGEVLTEDADLINV